MAAQCENEARHYARGVGSEAEQSATGPGHWRAIHDRLASRDLDDLTGDELDRLASARFWLNDPAGSIEAHQLACRRHQADGEPLLAVRSTWFLFYEHWLVGEAAVARGWLERGRRLLDPEDPERETVVGGWLDMAEADVALADGNADAAALQAEAARRTGQRLDDVDLTAMALQVEGRALVAAGDRQRGLARLDDAMVSVIGNELEPLYTGWVYCNAIGTWHAVGEIERATEWSDAALKWCESIAEGLLYPGLCRVYAAELAQLRGDWDQAEHQARQASADLATYDARYAGAAHYVVGDLCRLRGRDTAAEHEFATAESLGRAPQPGRSLLHAQQGRPAEALDALDGALRQPVAEGDAVVADIQTLLSLSDVAKATGADELVVAACRRVQQLADGNDTELVVAYRETAAGRAAAIAGDVEASSRHLGRAVQAFDALGLPYDASLRRLELATIAAAAGDDDLAAAATTAATAALERLGAPLPTVAADTRVDGQLGLLSAREQEVLGLVAAGLTNQGIAAELHLSPHTVARHLANIFAKLGVRSRTAASSMAVAAGLVNPGDGQI